MGLIGPMGRMGPISPMRPLARISHQPSAARRVEGHRPDRPPCCLVRDGLIHANLVFSIPAEPFWTFRPHTDGFSTPWIPQFDPSRLFTPAPLEWIVSPSQPSRTPGHATAAVSATPARTTRGTDTLRTT